MGAFNIAFDTIIVGALALPWVLLAFHLFSGKESRIAALLEWVGKQNQPAVAGVLLFAMAYSLGSAVSRIAQDCFDDDDMYFHVNRHLVRLVVTESSIRAAAYCEQQDLIPAALIDPLSDHHPEQFRTEQWKCKYTRKLSTAPAYEDWIDRQKKIAQRVFRVQEGALLLQGTDQTERLRQFHDQIMVLRGASFNGLIAFSLCLFWWSAQFKSWLRWATPLLYFIPGLNASYHHFLDRPSTDPPYMEFTLLVLAGAGWYVLWPDAPKPKAGQEQPNSPNGPGPIRFGYLVLAAFLTVTATLGWWATQVLYDEQVIYSSYRAPGQVPIEHPKK